MGTPRPGADSTDASASPARGLLVHCYADRRRDRLYLLGRLEDGRSFAAVESRWRPSLLVPAADKARVRAALARARVPCALDPRAPEPFDGRGALLTLRFRRYADHAAAIRVLGVADSPKPPEAYLTEAGIRGPLTLAGERRPGRTVDLVFPNPIIKSMETGPGGAGRVPLRLLSIDIETDVRTGAILAVGWSLAGGPSLVRVIPAAPPPAAPPPDGVVFHPDERSMLSAFLDDVKKADPDVLTGWNFLDFDFPRLAARCAHRGLAFTLGRSPEPAKFFPPRDGGADNEAAKRHDDGSWYPRRGSAAALVPGRQVIDALRVVRSGPRRLPGYTLEAVAQAVLGEGKLVASAGDSKIAELERLYRDDPVRFAEYCRRDASLVPEILERTGLFRLTVERAALTGVSLDKAWTSVVSFERIYGMELARRGVAPPPRDPAAAVSGAAGGTVLDPAPGVFPNVVVFDFRSLYPTIMRTFNVDPLSHARAAGGGDAGDGDDITTTIRAPNGAAFSRIPGILPGLIASYFAARRTALDKGDAEASHVYKILMNSFYGVLGTASCRYGRSELAGAITSFARKWLYASRDYFQERGFTVRYGDTDSLFVESGLGDHASWEDCAAWGAARTAEFNAFLAARIRDEYRLESFLELRFDKAYRRLMIQSLRGASGRGRAKGYGGLLLEPGGNARVEVKGMEAARSDATPLARRMQMELLELVFTGGGEAALRRYVAGVLLRMRQGGLDHELVYRKRLTRAPETYTASTPPQVKAARALGWKNRRGIVEYVWTRDGPAPASRPHAPLDYDHYADSQALPVARSIAAAVGWDAARIFPRSKGDRLTDGQLELEW